MTDAVVVATLPYSDIAEELLVHLEDVAPEVAMRYAKNAVIQVCEDLDLLRTRAKAPLNDDEKSYTFEHHGYELNEVLRAQDADSADFLPRHFYKFIVSRPDDSFVITPAYYDGQLPEEVIVEFSLKPKRDSERFPAVIKEKAEYACVLKGVGMLSQYAKGRTRNWMDEYKMEIGRLSDSLVSSGGNSVDMFFAESGRGYGGTGRPVY